MRSASGAGSGQGPPSVAGRRRQARRALALMEHRVGRQCLSHGIFNSGPALLRPTRSVPGARFSAQRRTGRARSGTAGSGSALAVRGLPLHGFLYGLDR